MIPRSGRRRARHPQSAAVPARRRVLDGHDLDSLSSTVHQTPRQAPALRARLAVSYLGLSSFSDYVRGNARFMRCCVHGSLSQLCTVWGVVPMREPNTCRWYTVHTHSTVRRWRVAMSRCNLLAGPGRKAGARREDWHGTEKAQASGVTCGIAVLVAYEDLLLAA